MDGNFVKHQKTLEQRKLAWYAVTYAQNAVTLCEAHNRDDLQTSVYDYRVIIHLAHLAIELSMKFALLHHFDHYPKTHNIDLLQIELEKINPEVQLRIPSYIKKFQRPGRSETLPLFPDLDDQIRPTTNDPLERFRYPTDRKGRLFEEPDQADISVLVEDLQNLSNDINQLNFRTKVYGL